MTAEELEGLTLPELIDRLADIAAPPPVSYAPETAGWWVLAAILVLAAVATAILLLRRRRRDQYRRLALAELRVIESKSGSGALTDVAALVRRTALVAFPRDQVAHLYGADWRDFLARTARVDLGPGVDQIVYGPYRRDVADAAGDNIVAARRWIRSHRA